LDLRNTTAIELAEPLPINAQVDLILKLDERLVGSELEITFGDSSFVGVLPGGTDVFTLRFSNSSESSSIRITANQDTGLGDSRFLLLVSVLGND
jgi:hypothetical protein